MKKSYGYLLLIFGILIGGILMLLYCKYPFSPREEFITLESNGNEFTDSTHHEEGTTQLKPGVGNNMIYLYEHHRPITRLRNEKGERIYALDFGKKIIDTVRKDQNIYGLRVYFARKEENDDPKKAGGYTLVVIPTDKDGLNIKDQTPGASALNGDLAFDWHSPCPPCNFTTIGRTSEEIDNLLRAARPRKKDK